MGLLLYLFGSSLFLVLSYSLLNLSIGAYCIWLFCLIPTVVYTMIFVDSPFIRSRKNPKTVFSVIVVIVCILFIIFAIFLQGAFRDKCDPDAVDYCSISTSHIGVGII